MFSNDSCVIGVVEGAVVVVVVVVPLLEVLSLFNRKSDVVVVGLSSGASAAGRFPFSLLLSLSGGFMGTSGGGAFFFFLLRDLIKIFVSSVFTDPFGGAVS